jgi:hypothetical protein
MIRRFALALILSAAAPAAPGLAQELGPGVKEVRDCMEKNVPRSVRQRIALEKSDRSGNTRALEATVHWKLDEKDRTRLLVRVEAPPDERGSAFLVIEREGGNDMFTYLPELRNVRRITSRTVTGSFFGSDFSYEDVLEIQSIANHAKVERLPDAQQDGRAVYVLSGTPAADSGSAYQRVVSRVDRETCVLLGADLYGKPEQLAKQVVVAFADVERNGLRWMPKKVTLRDLEAESESRIVIQEAEWDVAIPDRFFSQTELAQGH